MREDTFHLNRFKEAQREAYPRALAEIRAGYKRSHWMWYIFPQLQGLGRSQMATYYGISGRDEAIAYMADPVLSERLLTVTQAMLDLETNIPTLVLGSTDAMKLCSCMTLFEAACPEIDVFSQVLEKFYDGHRDRYTLSLLKCG